MFLGAVRKYMQIRGGLSQKELAQKVNVGISTMSRFLNQKTKELDSQVIAAIVAKLDIPLLEVIDFIEEESTEKFKKLVSFYKEESQGNEPLGQENTATITSAKIGKVRMPFGERRGDNKDLTIKDKLGTLSPRQKGFLTDFLDLDMESRDLVVDLGNSLFRYFRQSKADF